MCHTDTVPFAADWENALNPVVDAGMLHGCGACDVKGFLACLLSAAAQARTFADGAPHRVDRPRRKSAASARLGCWSRTCCGRAAWSSASRPNSASRRAPAKAIALPKSLFSAKRRTARIPAQGVSAIYHAAAPHSRHRGPQRQPLGRSGTTSSIPPGPPINIGIIEGGTAKNIVPGHLPISAGVAAHPRPAPGPCSVGRDADDRAAAENRSCVPARK